jgi:protein involved in polysaccharide export with SLBB domain
MRPNSALPAIRAAVTILALAVFTNIYAQSTLSATSMRTLGTTTGTSGNTMTPGTPMGMQGGASGFGLSGALSHTPPAPGMILPIDNSIDENEYLIGSGDVFFATVVESPTIRHTAAVDQSGRAFIPNVGLVDIGKTSYANAKKIIADAVSSSMRNPSEVYVTLIQMKNATVSFTGRIRAPGAYEFPGNTRLLDALRTANDDDLPHASDANMRQILLTNNDTTIVYDLMAYLHNGDNTQNPLIYPGDRIRVNPVTQKVFISGAIMSPPPSFYPLKDGETLREFLSIFTFDNSADTNAIILFRSADNASKTLTAADLDVVLNDLDAITIPVRKNQAGMYTVSITGEVASPGHYPIIENTTSARMLIEKAGGMKPTANADHAVVVRPIRNLPDRLSAGAPQMNVVRPERGTSIAMASASLDYAIIRLRLYNPDKIILEPGDRIVIPKKDPFVYISGAVKRPGAYPFLPGRDSHYYITQAGGYAKNADKPNIQVFIKYDDVVQSIEPKCVEPGSVIVVPTSVQYKFLTQVVLPIVTTVVTTIGVGISIYTLTR